MFRNDNLAAVLKKKNIKIFSAMVGLFWANTVFAETDAQALLRLHNNYRQQQGSQVLCLNQKLLTAAQNFCQYMASTGDFNHNSANGSTPKSRLDAVGYKYYTYGENIAYGQQSADSVMNAWINSPGHQRNIVNPNFKEAGFAKCGSAQRPYWVAIFGASNATACIANNGAATPTNNTSTPTTTNNKPASQPVASKPPADPLLPAYNACPRFTDGWYSMKNSNLYYTYYRNSCYQYNGSADKVSKLVKNKDGKVILQPMK